MARLTGISLENFKGISYRVHIPFKPLTLLFGANSAGKSTILQALHYAREVLMNHNPDPDSTELGGDSIDLGGFNTLVNGHDTSKQIRIRLTVHADNADFEPYNAVPLSTTGDNDADETGDFLDDEISIKNAWVELCTGIENDKAKVLQYSVGINDDKIGTISTMFDKVVLSEINFLHPLFRDDNNEMGLFLKESFSEGFLLPDSITMGSENHLIVEKPIEIYNQFLVIPKTQVEFNTSPSVDAASYFASTTEEDKNQALHQESYSDFWALMSRLFIRPLEIIQTELKQIRYIAPIRDIMPRNFYSPKTAASSRWANGFGAWDALLKDVAEHESPDEMQLVKNTSDYLNNGLGLGYTLKPQKQYLLPSDHPLISEIQLLAARYEERSAQHVRSKIIEPLMQLHTQKKLIIVDQKNGVEVEPYDVGVGVSQVLPVVVGSLERSASILAIEQPELHVHPAVACKLGDLFIREFVKQDRLCIIETHSEHLVLRLLRRIRETTNRPNDFDESLSLSVDDIAVITVENNEGVVSMVEIPVRDDGEFSRKWPKGFFEEREEELF